MLKTTNKGASWLALNSSTYKNLYSLYFIDENNGYSVGDSIIIKTTNAGNTWITYNMEFPMKSVFFVNSQLGFIASFSGVVIKTTDGGSNWSSMIAYDPAANYTSVYFSDVNTGYVVGLSGRYVKTTNSGINWEQKPAFYQKNYYSVQFPSKKNGFIIGGWINNIILKSVDEGETFDYMVSGLTGVRLFASSFIDTSNGIAVGREGNILRTNDAGVNWIDEASGTTSILYGVHYLNENTAYVVGDNGTILSTIQAIGISPVSTDIPSNFSLHQNYPNPFNPVSLIEFDIAKYSHVQLSVYNMLGKEIKTLVMSELAAGKYRVNFDASRLATGVYFYTLYTDNFKETKKMTLVK